MELILQIYSGITPYAYASHTDSKVGTRHTERERGERCERDRKRQRQKDRGKRVERDRRQQLRWCSKLCLPFFSKTLLCPRENVK